MVKAPSFRGERTKYTPEMRGIEILFPQKKSIGWAVGAKVTSRRYYGRRKPIFFGGQDGRVVKAGALGGTHD